MMFRPPEVGAGPGEVPREAVIEPPGPGSTIEYAALPL